MGYISPITNDTYKNYQARILKEDTSPHYIDKPFRVILKQLREEDERFYEEPYREEQEKEVDKQVEPYQMDTIMCSQMTGKGGLFNDRV